MNNLYTKFKEYIVNKLSVMFESSFTSRGILIFLITSLAIFTYAYKKEGFPIGTMIFFELIFCVILAMTYSKTEGLREASQFLAILILFSVLNAVALFGFLALFL
jgi:hypothetical protein